jgi:hypothetical protein
MMAPLNFLWFSSHKAWPQARCGAAQACKEMTANFLRSLCAVLTLATITLAQGNLYSSAWADAPCKVIRFKPGTSSATVSGSVEPDATACFSFATSAGQRVRLTITSKDKNTVFSVVGIADARDTYEFKSQKKTYELIVGQLMKSATPDAYQLTLSIK